MNLKELIKEVKRLKIDEERQFRAYENIGLKYTRSDNKSLILF